MSADKYAERRQYKWEIAPNPYVSSFDSFVTDDDQQAHEAILQAAESYLWDTNEGDDDGPHGISRVLKVTHNKHVKESTR